MGRGREALECGSLLPLWLEPACWLAFVLSIEIPASKLAVRKAAASCRTPKRAAPAQAVVAPGACPLFAGSAEVIDSQSSGH
jgi:hypothetical protein